MIRTATPQDARAIAALVDRAGHVQPGRSLYTARFPGGAAARIKQIESMVRAPLRTRFHWSLFWVAEVGGRVVAALACYDRANMDERGVQPSAGTPAPPSGTWTIDHVARLDTCESAGVLTRLANQAVSEGLQSGFCRACVDVPVPNHELALAFEAAGFLKRTEYLCGVPGVPDGYRVERLWRSLRVPRTASASPDRATTYGSGRT